LQKLVVRQSKSTQHRPIRIHSQGHRSQRRSPPACSHRRSRRHSRRREHHRRTGAWAWARGSRQQRRQTGREAGTGPFLACFCFSLSDWWGKSASLGVHARYLYLLFVLFSPIRHLVFLSSQVNIPSLKGARHL